MSCSKISTCSETSVERIQTSYTCVFFREVPEPVFRARETMMANYGEVMAIRAMMNRPQDEPQGDEEDGN